MEPNVAILSRRLGLARVGIPTETSGESVVLPLHYAPIRNRSRRWAYHYTTPPGSRNLFGLFVFSVLLAPFTKFRHDQTVWILLPIF